MAFELIPARNRTTRSASTVSIGNYKTKGSGSQCLVSITDRLLFQVIGNNKCCEVHADKKKGVLAIIKGNNRSVRRKDGRAYLNLARLGDMLTYHSAELAKFEVIPKFKELGGVKALMIKVPPQLLKDKPARAAKKAGPRKITRVFNRPLLPKPNGEIRAH